MVEDYGVNLDQNADYTIEEIEQIIGALENEIDSLNDHYEEKDDPNLVEQVIAAQHELDIWRIKYEEKS